MAYVFCSSEVERRFVGYLALTTLVVALFGAGCTDRLSKLVELKNAPASSTDVMVIRGVPPPHAAASTSTNVIQP